MICFSAKSLLLCATILTCAVGASPARAQTPGQDGADPATTLDEIVVTARNRSESLLDAPAAVAAFNAEAIEDAGISSARDALSLIPNVTSIEAQSSAFSFVLIRGITQVRNTDASVAFVLDGVLNTSPFSFSQELFDIEQIEVLKGPQGALYGRNSVGGAINIRTKAPTNDFEGQMRLGAGNGDFYSAQAVVSGPIVEDRLLFRLAGSVSDAEGWRDNIVFDRPQDPESEYGARLRLLYLPSETLTVDLRASAQYNEGSAQQFVNIAPRFQAANNAVPANVQTIGGDPTPVLAGPLSGLAGLVGNPNTSRPPLQSNVFGIDEREIVNAAAKIDWTLPFATATSITSWDLTDSLLGGDQYPYSSAAILKNSQRRRSEAISQELRLTSPDDQRFRWIVGSYFASTDFLFSANIQTDVTGGDPASINREPVRGGAEPSTSFNADDNANTSFALFGQAAYDVTSEFEISAALRWDREEREQTVVTPTDFIPAFVPLRTGDTRSLTFERAQPKVTLKYEPSDDFTVYANYSVGFRAGGFNPSGIAARAADLRATQPALGIQAGIGDTFTAETTEGFDAGVKGRLLDGRLQVEAAAFFTTVEDQFTFNFIAPLANAQVVRNIDESEVKGFELSAILAVNQSVRLFAGYGVTDTEITAWAAEPMNVGKSLPFIPEYTINAGVQVRHPIGQWRDRPVDMMGRLDWQRLGPTQFEPANFIAREEVDLINARVALELGEDLELSAWVKNATDEQYFAEYGSPPGYAFYGRPRQFGFELTKRY